MPAVIRLEVGDLPANQDGVETFVKDCAMARFRAPTLRMGLDVSMVCIVHFCFYKGLRAITYPQALY
jgi:hypothetical protein